MTIRNRLAGFLMGREVTVQEIHENPEILKDIGFKTYDCDVVFRRMGGVATTCINASAYPITQPIEDWKCKYCGCLRPSTEYQCGYCGAQRDK